MSGLYTVVVTTISIHALVKRATGGGTIPPPLIIISIHALVKRATRAEAMRQARELISIHALVKRATLSSFFSMSVT